MISFIVRRLAQALVVMAAIALISFVMFRYVGDPVAVMSREDASVSEREELRQKLGLDQPVWVQFGEFVGRVVQGDLGISYRNQRPVADLIKERLPATLELVLVATLLSLAIGIPLGVITAVNRNGWLATIVQSVSLVGISVPTFVTGIMLILVFAVTLRWLPSFGRGDTVDIIDRKNDFYAVAIPTLGLTECFLRPEALGQPYTGPCATGWVDSAYLEKIQ